MNRCLKNVQLKTVPLQVPPALQHPEACATLGSLPVQPGRCWSYDRVLCSSLWWLLPSFACLSVSLKASQLMRARKWQCSCKAVKRCKMMVACELAPRLTNWKLRVLQDWHGNGGWCFRNGSARGISLPYWTFPFWSSSWWRIRHFSDNLPSKWLQ